MRLTDILGEIVPLPTPEAQLNPQPLFDHYAQAVHAIDTAPAGEDDDKLLDLSLKLFDNDAARRTSIDTRAGSMMSAITLAATLVTGVGFTTFNSVGGLSSKVFWSLLATFVLALIYLTVTIILLFQIQGRRFRATPDPSDLPTPPALPNVPVPANPPPVNAPAPPAAPPSRYPRQIAVRMLNYTIYNYRVNNQVINRLWIAQKCFRNALVVLVIGGIATTLLMATAAPPPPDAERLAQALARSAGCTDLPALTVGKTGQWSGVCLRGGSPVSVAVLPNGETTLTPPPAPPAPSSTLQTPPPAFLPPPPISPPPSTPPPPSTSLPSTPPPPAPTSPPPASTPSTSSQTPSLTPPSPTPPPPSSPPPTPPATSPTQAAPVPTSPMPSPPTPSPPTPSPSSSSPLPTPPRPPTSPPTNLPATAPGKAPRSAVPARHD